MWRRQSLPTNKSEDSEEQPKKKRRLSDPLQPTKPKTDKASPSMGANPIKSLIGRKRKERKMKKTRGE